MIPQKSTTIPSTSVSAPQSVPASTTECTETLFPSPAVVGDGGASRLMATCFNCGHAFDGADPQAEICGALRRRKSGGRGGLPRWRASADRSRYGYGWFSASR